MAPNEPKISIIVAYDLKGGIGRQGGIPWNLKSDLAWFKQKTMGHYVIVGRKTWEGMRSNLPGRKVIVLTRNSQYFPMKQEFAVAHTLEEAISLAKKDPIETEIFVIGGRELNEAAIHLVDTLYITLIFANYKCDTFFPKMRKDSWVLVEDSLNEVSIPQFRIFTYHRK